MADHDHAGIVAAAVLAQAGGELLFRGGLGDLGKIAICMVRREGV